MCQSDRKNQTVILIDELVELLESERVYDWMGNLRELARSIKQSIGPVDSQENKRILLSMSHKEGLFDYIAQNQYYDVMISKNKRLDEIRKEIWQNIFNE